MNIIRINSVKRTVVPLFLASICLFSMIIPMAIEPSFKTNEGSSTNFHNSPTSAAKDFEQAIHGVGTSRDVRLFMENASKASGTNYFNITSDAFNDTTHYYFRNEKIKAIINLLENDAQGINASNISEKLSMGYNTVKKYIEVLENFKVLTPETENNKTIYKLNSESYQYLLEMIRQ